MDNYIINRIKNWNFTAEQIFSPNPFIITVSVLFSAKSEFISFPSSAWFCYTSFIIYCAPLNKVFASSFILYSLLCSLLIFTSLTLLTFSVIRPSLSLFVSLIVFFSNFWFLKECINCIYSCFVAFLQVY